MFKVEIKFDVNKLNNETVERLSTETDKIFAVLNLPSEYKGFGECIYTDNGSKNDYGRFWAVFFALKKASWFIENVSECTWFDGTSKKDLLTGFLRA